MTLMVLGPAEGRDTIYAPDAAIAPKRNLIERVIDYFDDSNKPKQYKPFDFSIIGGPHYSSDKGLGLGLVAEGLYRTDRIDTVSQPSSISIYGDMATNHYFNIGIDGITIFDHDRYRLQYGAYFQSFDTYYWGIGYDMNIDDQNKTRYKYLKSEALVDFTCRLAPHLYVGPMLAFDYIKGKHFARPEMWLGEPTRTFAYGLGITVRYDSRDFVSNASKGLLLGIDQKFYPRWMGNDQPFSLTEITAQYYHRLWKGAVGAVQLRSRLTYRHTPWGLLSTFGGSDLMRGYYEGRYRDKCDAVACIELRQHVWKRSGVVAWAGAGTIFPRLSELTIKHLLPNFGIGYRWEFKRRVNIRLDYGFGRHCSGFVFSINEAF